MLCLHSNDGVGVVHYEVFCGFVLKLRVQLACCEVFLMNLWGCTILRAKFMSFRDVLF